MYTDIKGEQALDVLIDIIDPLGEIIGDAEVEAAYKRGDKIGCIKLAISNHKRAVIKALAILKGEDPETYEPSVFALPAMLIQVLDDPEFSVLFPSQGTVTSSGSATVNTEENDK